MNSPNVPRNAYTNAPEQHPNLILGSLQLLFWLFFRPKALRNHVRGITSRGLWRNQAWWMLLIQGCFILPFLAYLLIILAFWGLGDPVEEIAFAVAWGGVASGMTLGLLIGAAISRPPSVASYVAFGLAFGVVFSMVWGVVSSVAKGLASGVELSETLGVVFDLMKGSVVFGLGVTLDLWRPVVFYPFLALWSALLYQLDKRRTGSKPSLLRWHSAFWDEWQFLPLHGLDKHLVLVMKRNPDEAKAAIEYLSTGRQRWAAWAAQIELDAPPLENCADVETIREVHLRLATDELEGPASALLRGFSRVSKKVNDALDQNSAFNQRLALNVVADHLDRLSRELTSTDKSSVRLHSIATRWCKIITNYERELAEAAKLLQEIDSPYIIGVPLTEQQEIFVARADISTQIEQLLLDLRRPPLLLYGQRRMGKTSLLNNLGRLLPNSIIPMFVDLQGPASLAKNNAGFLYNLAKSMVDSAQRQSAITIPRLTREYLAPDPFTCFDEWLDEVEQVLDRNTALLALDEFEALDSAITKGRLDEEEVLGMLRHLIQHRPRFKILLAGSHTIEEFQRWASYLINVQVLHISYLKEPEARQLIERPVKDFALRYEPDAVQRVLDLTRCHPFLVQLLCAEIVALKNDRDPSVRRLATLTDVEDAVPEALETGSFFFADIQNNQIDKLGLDILRLIAARGEGAIVPANTIAQQFSHAGDRPLNLLLRRELLEEVDGGYRFQVELIRRWFAS